MPEPEHAVGPTPTPPCRRIEKEADAERVVSIFSSCRPPHGEHVRAVPQPP
ncbi:MAG: hypothetical protein IPM13_19550 [Phycisphaerales bacterium]|nr:hypothetical protein [Phycisphaerales bacterium]